jgi:hypothetical protein
VNIGKAYMEKLYLMIGLLVCTNFFGCSPHVRIDPKEMSKDSEKLKGKNIILVTDIADLHENPISFVDKKIELKGYVEYRRTKKIYYWNFLLKDDNGRCIICYERHYRPRPWLRPVYAIMKAERVNDIITIVGRLKEDLKIELDWIEYDNETIDTDYVPPFIKIPWPRRAIGIPGGA